MYSSLRVVYLIFVGTINIIIGPKMKKKSTNTSMHNVCSKLYMSTLAVSFLLTTAKFSANNCHLKVYRLLCHNQCTCIVPPLPTFQSTLNFMRLN